MISRLVADSYRWYVGYVVGDRCFIYSLWSQGSRALIWIIGAPYSALLWQWS